jgi:hypothetical protein
MRNEPALRIGAGSAVVAATLSVVVAFGAPLTDEQVQAILGLTAVLSPVATSILTRRRVTPHHRQTQPTHEPETAAISS